MSCKGTYPGKRNGRVPRKISFLRKAPSCNEIKPLQPVKKLQRRNKSVVPLCLPRPCAAPHPLVICNSAFCNGKTRLRLLAAAFREMLQGDVTTDSMLPRTCRQLSGMKRPAVMYPFPCIFLCINVLPLNRVKVKYHSGENFYYLTTVLG